MSISPSTLEDGLVVVSPRFSEPSDCRGGWVIDSPTTKQKSAPIQTKSQTVKQNSPGPKTLRICCCIFPWFGRAEKPTATRQRAQSDSQVPRFIDVGGIAPPVGYGTI